ncbi:MAG: MFS transporter [Alphaproteobacteria bacterium]
MFSFDPASPNALRHPLYLQWTVGFAIGSTGLWLARLALGYVVWELTQSPFLTGMTAFLILALPGILGPFIGVWVENLNPKSVIMVAQVNNLLIYLVLALIAFLDTQSAIPYLIASGATGLLVAYWQPARLVMPTVLVPQHALASAVAVNSTLFNSARIIGPALAAWIIAFGSLPLAFLAGFALYLVFFISVLFLPTQWTPPERAAGGYFERFSSGLQEIRRHRLVILALAAVTFSGFFGRSIVELMPAINGALVSNSSAQTLGYLTSAAGAGAITIGMALAARRGSAQTMLGLLFFGGIFGGAAVLLMAFVTSIWLLLPVAYVSGAAGSLTVIGSQASILQTAPIAFRARIMAVWGAVAIGGMGLGGLVGGGLASMIGLSSTLIVFGGVGMVGSGLLWIGARQRN